MADLNNLLSPFFLNDKEIRKVIELLFFSYRDFTSGPDKILEKLNFGLSSIDNLSAYMYKIISNTWKDELRKKYRNVEIHVDEMIYNNLPDLETSSNDGNIDTLNEIKDSIKSLSLKLREVLILVALENKSYKETAEILNIPIGTVMSRLNEARKKLSAQKKNEVIKEVN